MSATSGWQTECAIAVLMPFHAETERLQLLTGGQPHPDGQHAVIETVRHEDGHPGIGGRAFGGQAYSRQRQVAGQREDARQALG